MIAFLLIAAAVATALLFAVAAGSKSLVTTLLVAYLAFVSNLGLTVLVLSPAHAVTRGGLAGAEAVLLAAALGTWWARGRPVPPLGPARAALHQLRSSPVTAIFVAFVLVLLVYELVLGLTVPPNNGDALAYHLAKAAAWAQHGGYYWIPNAPTVRMNAFQPFAEQQLLFLFVATHSGALASLPQFLAELAILVAVFGASRRLGFGVLAAAGGACLLATFSLLALEATTAQNDLVAASFPAVAVCLLLGDGRLEPMLAGVAAGLGLGTKLTTAFALPILVWLAFARGRRTLAWSVLGGIVGFAAIGMWGYVLNDIHSGHVLGSDTGGVENRASPAYPRSVSNFFILSYGLMDGSVLSSYLIHLLALGGIVVGLAVALWAGRRTGAGRAFVRGLAVATPFVAPLLVIGGAAVLAFIADRWGFPIRGDNGILKPVEDNLNEEYGRISNEDYSAFGPVGIVALLAAIALTVRAFVRGKADWRHLALAAALPVFLIVISLTTAWNPFLIRFFAVPAVLAAPLLPRLFSGPATTAAYLGVAGLAIVITLLHAQTKPFTNPYGLGHPWQLTQAESLDTNSRGDVAKGVEAFEQAVPKDACIGAILDVSEPSYLLYGPHFDRHVVYLSPDNGLETAYREGLSLVVITLEQNASAADQFRAAGWKIEPLGGYWQLATDPRARATSCT